jgi:hypothetical protein
LTAADPGSFRDPASRIVHDEGRVLRLLDARGLEAWRALSESTFFKRAVDDGRLIPSEEVPAPDGSAGAIEHPQLPFISYPYEWTFAMLKDAALLQLDLLAEALTEGLTIKDATPFNVQFHHGKPIFIDVGSFEPYEPGEAWIGYRQFTRQFLFPLMMRSWAELPFQPWLRGDMEGPTAAQMRQMLPFPKRLRPSALMHVTLQARMEDRMSGQSVRQDLKKAGFSSDLILANVKKLRSLIDGLTTSEKVTTWSDYKACQHVERDRDAKAEFLGDLLEHHEPDRLLDLGANDGHFSLIAAARGTHAIAVDGDERVLDDLYRRSRGESISIVMTDLANPTPSQGWAGEERPSLASRARPNLVLAYGLIHHLIYTASVPPKSVMSWLRDFDCPIALEFVSPEDEMVDKLTANKLESELHTDRTETEFRSLIQTLFEIGSEKTLPGGTRILFELIPG